MIHLKLNLLWRGVMLGAIIGLGVMLAGCVPATPSPPAAPLPTSVPTVTQPPPKGVLEIGGIGKSTSPGQVADPPVTLQIASADAQVLRRLNMAAKDILTATFTQTTYLEYALIHQDGTNWRLFYAELPSEVVTPTRSQAHLVRTTEGNLTLLNSFPEMTITATQPISASNPAGTPIEFESGIKYIRAALGQSIPPGNVFKPQTAWFLLSDGNATHKRYALAVFGDVPANGKPLMPGGPDDPRVYCSECVSCAWWCVFYGR